MVSHIHGWQDLQAGTLQTIVCHPKEGLHVLQIGSREQRARTYEAGLIMETLVCHDARREAMARPGFFPGLT